MRLKIANAYCDKSGKHQILWLAGGYAVYRYDGREEIFECLDEAIDRAGVKFEQDPELIKAWSKGYELPADEDHKWPEIFLVEEEK